MNAREMVFKDLEEILVMQCDAHQQLLEATCAVNAAIKESDLAVLQSRTSMLDDRILQVGKLEDRRKECCCELSQALEIGRTEVRMRTIIDKAPLSIKASLQLLHEKLTTAIEKIAKTNVSNKVLLEEGLQIVRGRFSMITRTSERFTNYRHHGQRTNPKLSFGAIINRTV